MSYSIILFKKVKLLYIFILLANITKVQGQEYFSKRPTQINDFTTKFEVLSSTNGLSNNLVNDILQDEYGFMWFATADGLNKYDGYSFTVYKNNPNNSKSISDNYITSITTDSKGILWIATKNGLNYYDRKTDSFIHYFADPNDATKIQDNYIRKIICDNSGTIWFDTQQGFLHKKLSANTFKYYKHNSNNNEIYPQHEIFDDNNGNLYVGSSIDEILIFNKTKETYVYLSELLSQETYNTLPENKISLGGLTSAIKDKTNNIYLYTTNGRPFIYVPNTKKIKPLPFPSVYSIINDKKGNLWLTGWSLGIIKYSIKENIFNHYRYNNNDEYSIAGNQNFCSYIDKSGNIWFGGEEGITIYKPNKYLFKHYRHIVENDKTINSNKISAIIQAKDSIIWIGTSDKGLIEFDYKKHTFINYQKTNDKNSILNNSVSSLYQGYNGNIYIGQWTGEGFDKFDKKNRTFTHCSTPYNPGYTDWLSGFIEDKNNNLYTIGWGVPPMCNFDIKNNIYTTKSYSNNVISNNNINNIYAYNNLVFYNFVVYNSESKEFYTFGKYTNKQEEYFFKTNIFYVHDGIDYNFVNVQYFKANNNKLYLATTKSLLLFNQQTKKKSEVFNGKVIAIGQSFEKNKLLLITEEGITEFDITNNKSIQLYANQYIENILPTAIYTDNSGNIWLSSKKGLGEINTKTKQFYLHTTKSKNSISNNNVTKLIQDKNGVLWIGTHNGINLYNYKTGKFELLQLDSKQQKNKQDIINVIFRDKENTMWVGTESGLYKYNYKTKKFTNYSHNKLDKNTLFSNTVLSITQVNNLDLYIGTSNGLCSYNIKKNIFTRFDEETKYSLQNGLCLCGIKDRKGNMWIGQDSWGGINKIDANTGFVTHYFEKDYDSKSFKGPHVNFIYEDKKGTIWAGSEKGLSKFNEKNNNFTLYTIKNGFPSNEIIAMTEDKNGFLWITTNKGLVKFNSIDEKITTYKDLGLQGNDFSLKSCITMNNGNIVIGGNNGFNIFNPDSLKNNTTKPQIELTRFYIYDSLYYNDLTDIKTINLNYYENNFTIEFAALEYTDSKKNKYKYKLVGYDNKWINTNSNNRLAKYTNLPYGKYIFKVIASNNSNIWNTTPRSIIIIISPPWWQTFWAYLLFGILFLVLIFAIYKWRIKKLDQQKKHLEELVKNRTYKINEQNEELKQQSEELRVLNESLNQNNEELAAQRDEIQEQKYNIEKANININESIDYANRLQRAILSNTEILKKYLSDFFILYNPKDKVSGDFYWWTHIENKTIIAVADCTGHGVPGAFMSMLGSSLLREIIQKEYITHTGVILRRLRKEIIKTLNQKGEIGEQNDGMDISIITIDNKTNTVQYSGANNPLYIITNNARILKDYTPLKDYNGFYEIKPDKMPISIYEKMDNFQTNDIKLEKGDKLYMFSDGYADQFGGQKGKKYKYKSFKDILFNISELAMEEQKNILDVNFENWKNNEEQTDDVLILGLKI